MKVCIRLPGGKGRSSACEVLILCTMKRQLSPWVLVLLAALACYSRANTDTCGSFDYTCFNETHFEMCIQETSGIMMRSGELQACPTGLKCVTNSIFICSDVSTNETTEGTTKIEPYTTSILEDRTSLPTTQNIESTQVEEIGNGEEDQNIAKGVQDMTYQKQHQQQKQQQHQEQQQQQQHETQEEMQQHESPSEQMDLAAAIEPVNIQQPEFPELVQFEEADLAFVPQFPLAYHFQSDAPSAYGFLKHKFSHNSQPKLVHAEPSEPSSLSSFNLSNFTCPGAGLFPAPPSCTDYHLCIHIGPVERHYLRSCWKGFEFSPRWRICLPRILSDCLKNGSRAVNPSLDEDDSQSQESEESDESDESNQSNSSESR